MDATRAGALTVVVAMLAILVTRPLLAQVAARPLAGPISVAEPLAPIDAPRPEGAPANEVQVVVQAVVDTLGRVESAVATSRAPGDAPASFDAAAAEAVKAATFRPSTRDGRAIRSRVEYVVVFPARVSQSSQGAPAAPAPSSPSVTTNEQDEDYTQLVRVHGVGWSSPRGLGDFRVTRDLLDASPRAQTSELLSAAPGFFVDHEDAEGLGNDVRLRGFDLDHGSGIEMRIGSIPINSPMHIHGQGYADLNFIIPEVVRSVRVLEGPYDPRQGDAAIVGSAYFDLAVPERGYQAKATYGSFNQWRLVGIGAPRGVDDETFLAFSVRQTDGFGQSRASQAGSTIAQYGFDLGDRDHVRLLATAYDARAALAGVVRQDDLDAGRVGYYGTYGGLAQNQSAHSSRVILGVDFDHLAGRGEHFEFAPWVMWTDFLARQNYTGSLQTLGLMPPGPGDLFQTTNAESAAGIVSRWHSVPFALGSVAKLVAEPGVYVRVGHTDQTKSLLNPSTLSAWDPTNRLGTSVDSGLDTLDGGAYVDLDLRILERLRISGGPRVELLSVSVSDRLAGVSMAAAPDTGPPAHRSVAGIVAGPRVTAEYNATDVLTPVVSYGEGFRSLDAGHLQDGDSHPYSKVRSVEAGLRSDIARGRYVTTVSVFQTWIENELVFDAVSGGLQTEEASTRSGLVGSVVTKPCDWLLASTAVS
ncbi:MAG TPA: TonB-dependent receptor, partial [Polyangiaceae bacterium]|nr:TonB-dependent receptor [Polyangiaceae bacterium]